MPSLLDILGYAGNFLDLPGSSVRDLLSGNNPFDQWDTPFSSDNRATGRDVLRPFLGENEETGMSGWLDNPMEGLKDIAGFGLEMVADPLNFVSLSPLWRALKGRKAVKGANAAQELANRGRYGYVNAKLLADDMLGVAQPVSRPPVQLNGEITGQLDEMFQGDFQDPTGFAGVTSKYITDDPQFTELYLKRGRTSQYNEATGASERFNDAIIIPRVEVANPGTGTYRALHDQLTKYGKPIVVQGAHGEGFADKLRHMGYRDLGADDFVFDNPMAEQVGPKLLGYTPAPESWRYPGREVGHHGGHYWGDSATPHHPYGMMDLDRIHTGEGNTVKGPGGYIADEIRTTDRYYDMVANQAPGPDPKIMNTIWDQVRAEAPVGREISYNTLHPFAGRTPWEDVLMDAKAFSSMSETGGNLFKGVVTTGWDGTRLKYDELWDTPVGRVRNPGESELGFRSTEWQDHFYGGLVPTVAPKPTRYTLDMPAGTKDRMMNWEGRFYDQPKAVQDLVDKHPAVQGLTELDALEQRVFSYQDQLARLKRDAGVDPLDLKFQSEEADALRQMIAEASTAAERKKQEILPYFGGDEYRMETGLYDGEDMADLLMGKHPARAKFEDVTGLLEAGVPGMKNLATSTGKSAYNYAIWDKDLWNQMRVRAINEQEVPINPMFGPVKAEQRVIPQIADSPLTEVINPMSPQPLPGLAKPAMQGAAYQALARFNSYGGSL